MLLCQSGGKQQKIAGGGKGKGGWLTLLTYCVFHVPILYLLPQHCYGNLVILFMADLFFSWSIFFFFFFCFLSISLSLSFVYYSFNHLFGVNDLVEIL